MSTTITLTKTIPKNKVHNAKVQWNSIYEELCENIREEDGVTILEASSIENTTRLRLWLLYQNSNLSALNDDQKIKVKRIIDRFDNEQRLPLEVTTRKTFSRWMLKYKEMNRVYGEIGKGKAISRYKCGTFHLSKWVSVQRTALRDNTLANWQISLLQKSGIKPSTKLHRKKITEEQENKWNEYYELLKKFQKEHGHCNVPTRIDFKFSSWLNHQREFFSKKLLRQDRKDKLDALGFCWEKTFEKKHE